MNCDFCYLKIEWRLYIIFNKSHISEKYCLGTVKMQKGAVLVDNIKKDMKYVEGIQYGTLRMVYV